jgi:hypothetical protein
MLINNDFVFLPIPKNASTSIVYSVIKWGIDVDFGLVHLNKTMLNQFKNYSEFWHPHYTIDFFKDKFPNKRIIGIKRDSTDRFISALKYMIINCKIENVNLKYDFKNLSEDSIIEIFSNLLFELNNVLFTSTNNKVDNKLFQYKIKSIIKKYLSDEIDDFNGMYLLNFASQYFWGLHECDVIIDIKNLNEFESIIKTIKPTFNLIKTNKSDEIHLKINKSNNIVDFVNNNIDYFWLNEKLKN